MADHPPSPQPDDIDLLVNIMPPQIREAIERKNHRQELIEIVLDLGRLPETRFPDRLETLLERPIAREDIDYVVSRMGTFSEDNRAGIERTLHRISAIRNRLGTIIGLTCRVGRAIFGTVDILKDVIESGNSLLLLGRPGVGKTTLLREAARVLADEVGKRVVIVDTSNEIGGDGDIPHPGIGRARRMQVPSPGRQHAVMIEAVENHMPEVIVIDEIGTEAETFAARTIAERGVQLVATAHGNVLENLLQNPTLADLVGGVQVVTISDEEARRRGTRKSVLERKAPPTFSVLVELLDKDRVAIHHDLANVVDAFLDGLPAEPELRIRTPDGRVEVQQESSVAEPAGITEGLPGRRAPRRARRRIVRIHTYAVSKSRLEQLIRKFKLPAEMVEDVNRADLVLTLKSQEKRQPRRVRELQERGVPLHVIRSNTATQIENFLRSFFQIEEQVDGEEAAMLAAEKAVSEVFEKGNPVELSPQAPHLRALQHQLAQRYGLLTESKGRDPFRRVIIFPL
jgi:stage III sporulation protein SpoIIIAA